MTSRLSPSGFLLAAMLLPVANLSAAEPLFEKIVLFEADKGGFRLDRIPGVVVMGLRLPHRSSLLDWLTGKETPQSGKSRIRK